LDKISDSAGAALGRPAHGPSTISAALARHQLGGVRRARWRGGDRPWRRPHGATSPPGAVR